MFYEYRLFLAKLDKTLMFELDIKDIDYVEFLTEPDEISFSFDKFLNGIAQLEDTRFDLVKNLYYVLLEKYSNDTLLSSKYFSIIEPVQTTENGKVELKVKCMSTDYQEFNRRRIRGYNQPSVTLSDVLTYVAATPLFGAWTIGTLPSKATSEYHTVTVDDETITSFFKTIEENWDVLILPDTFTNTLNVYDRSTYGNAVDLVLGTDNFINSASYSPKMDQLVTRLYVYGKDGVGISSVNPTGVAYIDDFSYFINAGYFSSSLLGAWNTYVAKVASCGSSFATLISNLNAKQSELLSLQNDLVNLNTQKVIYDDTMSVYQSLNKRETAEYTAVYLNWVNNNGLIVTKESDIATKEGEITSTLNSIYAINADLAYSNTSNFSTVQLQELSKYIYEQTLNMDTLSDVSLLYQYGVNYITAKNSPVYEIDLDSADLFAISEAQNVRSLINVGDYIYLDLGDISLDMVSLQLVSYSHNPVANKLSFKFSNTNTIASSLYYLTSMFVQANRTANEVKNNASNWNQFVADRPNILYEDDTINAGTTKINAGTGNVIDHRGFVGTDIGGSHPGYHMKLNDDKLILTKNDWETFNTLLSADGLYLETPSRSFRIVITPEYGFQIDKNVGTSATPIWDNRMLLGTNDEYIFEGEIRIGDALQSVIIDRFGIDSAMLRWFTNLANNSGAKVATTAPVASTSTEFIPAWWTGCVSSDSAIFIEDRSFKVAPSATMANLPETGNGRTFINPQWLPSFTSKVRVSWWGKLGQAQIKIYDQTNASYFTINKYATLSATPATVQTFDRQENWGYNQGKPDSVWFDSAEAGHAGCTDIRIQITNIHATESLYVNAIQLTADKTSSWAQLYTPGPNSTATALGIGIESSGSSSTGIGGVIGNVEVQDDFSVSAPEKSVLVDTNDYSRYDKKTITTATTLVYGDNEYINVSGATTVTLFAASTVETEGAGKVAIFMIKNIGTDLVTVAGTIDGLSSWYIYPGEQYTFYSAGTEWKVG